MIVMFSFFFGELNAEIDFAPESKVNGKCSKDGKTNVTFLTFSACLSSTRFRQSFILNGMHFKLN